MAKCFICDKEAEDRSLFSHFSFGGHFGDKSIKLKCQWVDDKEKDVVICQRCCANTLKTFANSFSESLPGDSHLIM